MRPNLTTARLAKGLSQKQLGEMVGLSDKSISALERGRMDTLGKTWSKLANIFSLSQEELQHQPETEGRNDDQTPERDFDPG